VNGAHQFLIYVRGINLLRDIVHTTHESTELVINAGMEIKIDETQGKLGII
jgi:hypothetical protein